MRTQGEIEAAISEGISRFEQDYMGRGPKDIHAHLLGDLLVVRLQGVLTAAEQHLVKSLPAEKGRDLLKQVRTHLIETARPVLEAMVQEIKRLGCNRPRSMQALIALELREIFRMTETAPEGRTWIVTTMFSSHTRAAL